MAEYRIYILGRDGRINLAYTFVAADDDETIEEANKYSANHTVEIWQRNRLVNRIAIDGTAVAISYGIPRANGSTPKRAARLSQ